MSAQLDNNQMPIGELIQKTGITLKFDYTDRNPTMPDSDNMDHYKCTLRSRVTGKQMTLVFSKGYGHNGKPPEANEVLDCLASDASGIENSSGDFEEWCSEYGYDTDSRRAEKIFKATSRQAEQLKRLMGDDYETLLWNTERM